VPRRQSVTGRRLCSGIFTEGDFAIGNVAKGGFEDDENAGKTSEADEGQTDVVAREDGPGFHLCFVTVVIIAECSRIRKVGKPTQKVG
jgi:hypothetical protein